MSILLEKPIQAFAITAYTPSLDLTLEELGADPDEHLMPDVTRRRILRVIATNYLLEQEPGKLVTPEARKDASKMTLSLLEQPLLLREKSAGPVIGESLKAALRKYGVPAFKRTKEMLGRIGKWSGGLGKEAAEDEIKEYSRKSAKDFFERVSTIGSTPGTTDDHTLLILDHACTLRLLESPQVSVPWLKVDPFFSECLGLKLLNDEDAVVETLGEGSKKLGEAAEQIQAGGDDSSVQQAQLAKLIQGSVRDSLREMNSGAGQTVKPGQGFITPEQREQLLEAHQSLKGGLIVANFLAETFIHGESRDKAIRYIGIGLKAIEAIPMIASGNPLMAAAGVVTVIQAFSGKKKGPAPEQIMIDMLAELQKTLDFVVEILGRIERNQYLIIKELRDLTATVNQMGESLEVQLEALRRSTLKIAQKIRILQQYEEASDRAHVHAKLNRRVSDLKLAIGLGNPTRKEVMELLRDFHGYGVDDAKFPDFTYRQLAESSFEEVAPVFKSGRIDYRLGALPPLLERAGKTKVQAAPRNPHLLTKATNAFCRTAEEFYDQVLAELSLEWANELLLAAEATRDIVEASSDREIAEFWQKARSQMLSPDAVDSLVPDLLDFLNVSYQDYIREASSLGHYIQKNAQIVGSPKDRPFREAGRTGLTIHLKNKEVIPDIVTQANAAEAADRVRTTSPHNTSGLHYQKNLFRLTNKGKAPRFNGHFFMLQSPLLEHAIALGAVELGEKTTQLPLRHFAGHGTTELTEYPVVRHLWVRFGPFKGKKFPWRTSRFDYKHPGNGSYSDNQLLVDVQAVHSGGTEIMAEAGGFKVKNTLDLLTVIDSATAEAHNFHRKRLISFIADRFSKFGEVAASSNWQAYSTALAVSLALRTWTAGLKLEEVSAIVQNSSFHRDPRLWGLVFLEAATLIEDERGRDNICHQVLPQLINLLEDETQQLVRSVTPESVEPVSWAPSEFTRARYRLIELIEKLNEKVPS